MSRKVTPHPPAPQPPAPPATRGYPQEELPLPPAAPPNPVLGRVVVLGSRLYKYWRNLGAVFLVALALLTLFGLTGLSSGSWLIACGGRIGRPVGDEDIPAIAFASPIG